MMISALISLCAGLSLILTSIVFLASLAGLFVLFLSSSWIDGRKPENRVVTETRFFTIPRLQEAVFRKCS